MDKHIPRLYYQEPLLSKRCFFLLPEQAHHIFNVLRKKKHDIIKIFNEQDGEFNAIIIGDKKNPQIEIAELLRKPCNMPNVTLCFALLQGQKHHNVIEKATELGVRAFCPFISDYTQVSAKNSESLQAKMQKIALHASEQCGRMSVPYIHPIQTYDELLTSHANKPLFLCAEKGAAKPFSSSFVVTDGEPSNNNDDSFIVIGPEGGFSALELANADKYKSCHKVTLGSTILKADTASIVALTLWLNTQNWLNLRP